MSTKADKVNHVKCKSSASLINNNLVCLGPLIGFAHKSEIHLIRNSRTLLNAEASCKATQSSRSGYKEKDAISQLQLMEMKMGQVMVVLSYTGLVHVYAEHCLKKAASIQFGKSGDTEGMTGASVELKGVCTDGEDSILVGSGDGTITVLKVAGDTLTITKAFSSSEHTSAINCLCLDPVSGQLISGDDTGKLVFWQGSVGGGFTVLRAIKGEGFPCNSLQAGHGFLVAAFSTGAVHLHSLSKPGTAAASSPLKRIEINAHSRSVSAVDIHPKQRMFATCGEDSFVTVWSLPAASQGTHDMQVSSVKNLLVTSPGTAINTGVKFLGTDHSLIGVTSYDSRFLTVLKTPSL